MEMLFDRCERGKRCVDPGRVQPCVRRWWERERFSIGKGIWSWGESMTQQAHFDQTDVNAIVKRFERTGVMPVADPARPAQYGDVTDLQSATLAELITRSREATEAAERFMKDWKEPEEPAPVSQVPAPVSQVVDPPAAT